MEIETKRSTDPRTREALAGLGFIRDALGRWSCPDLGRDIEGWFRLFLAAGSLNDERYAEYRKCCDSPKTRPSDWEAKAKVEEAWAETSHVCLEVERKMAEILDGRVHVLPDGRFLVPVGEDRRYRRVKVMEKFTAPRSPA